MVIAVYLFYIPRIIAYCKDHHDEGHYAFLWSTVFKTDCFFCIMIEVGRGLERWELLTPGNVEEPNLLQNIALLLSPAVGSGLFPIVPGIGEFCPVDA